MKKIKHYNIMLVEDEELLRQSLARHIAYIDTINPPSMSFFQ